MKGLLDGIDIGKLEVNDVEDLKKKLKEIEKQVKENNKPKTITVSSKSHNIIKRYCQTFNLNIGEWAEKTLLKEIEESNCVIVDDENLSSDEVQEMKVKELMSKYSNNKVSKNLIKTNKPIMSKDLKYEGWSIIDGYYIYNYIGDDFVHFKLINQFENIGLKDKKAMFSEISTVSKVDDIDTVILSNQV